MNVPGPWGARGTSCLANPAVLASTSYTFPGLDAAEDPPLPRDRCLICTDGARRRRRPPAPGPRRCRGDRRVGGPAKRDGREEEEEYEMLMTSCRKTYRSRRSRERNSLPARSGLGTPPAA